MSPPPVAKAFAPGHITGFFEIKDGSGSLEQKGSRGAGFCLSVGAKSEVHLRNYTGNAHKMQISINGKNSRAPVTRKAVKFLLSNPKCRSLPGLDVRIRTVLQLPSGQGFGMSGAGALSAVLALADRLNRTYGTNLAYSDSAVAAHCAEVLCKTGLGDIAGQTSGGWEIRVKAGIPPYGRIIKPRIKSHMEVVVAVLGSGIRTRDVLARPESRTRIISIGKKCVDEFVKKQTLPDFFRICNEFSWKTGLAGNNVKAAIRDAENYGMAAQTMLGNSVFAMGDTLKIARTLKKHGKVLVCRIGNKARVI
jgi:pantoate kinase